jgi:putative transposase
LVFSPWNWKNPKKNPGDILHLVISRAPELTRAWLAKLFGRSRASLYYYPKQAGKDLRTYQDLVNCLSANPSYGQARLALALGLGKRHVKRVMKLFDLKPYKRKARWRKRRDERREPAIYTNQIKDCCPRVPNYIWVSDFTYLEWQGKFIYLATVMDLYTREIIGWHVSTRHTTELVIKALHDALITTRAKPTFVHSDQGSEYLAKDYIKFVTGWGITISMSKKASPWENGYQESFYNNFKTDLGLEFNRFDTLGQFTEAIHQAINYYNKDRIHTTLKTSPTLFAQQKFLERVSKERDT